MAWPKGVARGPMSTEHKQKVAASNSAAQKLRWADPEKRAVHIAGLRRSYQDGPLAYRKVIWTEDMDAELRKMRESMKFSAFREEAARRLGVSDRVLMTRIRTLGLTIRAGMKVLRVGKKREPARRKTVTEIYRELGL